MGGQRSGHWGGVRARIVRAMSSMADGTREEVVWTEKMMGREGAK